MATHKLAARPDSVGGLGELRLFDLRANPLTHLPATLAAPSRLEKLDLRWIDTPHPSTLCLGVIPVVP